MPALAPAFTVPAAVFLSRDPLRAQGGRRRARYTNPGRVAHKAHFVTVLACSQAFRRIQPGKAFAHATCGGALSSPLFSRVVSRSRRQPYSFTFNGRQYHAELVC